MVRDSKFVRIVRASETEEAWLLCVYYIVILKKERKNGKYILVHSFSFFGASRQYFPWRVQSCFWHSFEQYYTAGDERATPHQKKKRPLTLASLHLPHRLNAT